MERANAWQNKVGERLREKREQKGFTRLALAEQIGTKQNYIAEIERSARTPSLSTFVNILLALEISADSLIFGVSEDMKDERENILKEFLDFLGRRSNEDIKALLDISQVTSKYIGLQK